jgi:hypothetical protein
MKGQCRVCLTKQMINKDGRMKSHPNKYTSGNCRGSYKLPIEGTVFGEAKIGEPGRDSCVMAVLGVFSVFGALIGLGVGFILWGG